MLGAGQPYRYQKRRKPQNRSSLIAVPRYPSWLIVRLRWSRLAIKIVLDLNLHASSDDNMRLNLLMLKEQKGLH